MSITFLPHYECRQIDSIKELKQIFTQGTNYGLNWLLGSTSGVHGSYAALYDLEWAEPDYKEEREKDEMYFTVLVIQPRLCVMRYGEIPITKAEIPWLRQQISNSIDAIQGSQYFNTSMDWRSADPERWNRRPEHNQRWREHINGQGGDRTADG